MKTLLVLCSLATIAIAVPTSLRENLDSLQLTSENIPGNIREKKSAEHDSAQGLTINDEKENTQMRHSHKTKIETSWPGKTKINYRKPIIVKKNFGYQFYRDSDEEMAHADPYENCRKQFKVKLCDGEPILHTHSNNVKSVISESREPESNSEKEMENSIKMVKEAVENLESGLQLMEHNSAKKSDSRESLDSGITLQQDIEMAKSALNHIQRRMSNLEAKDITVNNKEIEETKSRNKWKEAIDDIHKNAEISKNIEDAFNFQTQHSKQTDNVNIPRRIENEQSENPNKENHNNNIEHPSNFRSSTTNDEHEINESDMFVASTNHKESEVLRGESLTADNDFNSKSLDSHDPTNINFNSNQHPVTTKNSEILSTDLDIQNTKMMNTDMPQEKVTGDIKMTTLKSSDDENLLSADSITNTKNQIDFKDKENSESIKSTKEECEEEQQHEEHKHSPVHNSGEKIIDQNESEIKTTEMATDNMHSSDPKTTLLNENEEKSKVLSSQKDIEASENNSLANLDKNKENDVTKAHDLHSSNVNHENTHLSSLKTAESGSGQPNEFPSLRRDENHNTNHLLNVNIEDQLNDFHQSFMRLAQEKQLNDMLLQQLKNMEHSDNEHKIILHAKANEFVPTEDINFHMDHIHDTLPLGTQESQHFMAMPSIPSNRQIDHSPQHMKSAIELPNGDTSLTAAKTNTLKNVEHSSNGHTNMRLVEGINIDNLGHDITETQHFNNPLWAERWAQETQQGSHAFKTKSELNNMDMLLTPTNNNEFHSGHHAHTENMNMRTMEGLNLGQLLTDTNEMNDPHSMRWAQDKHTHGLAQTFDAPSEYHNKAKWNNHFHESTPTNAVNNFGLDGNQELYPMRSGMPDHFHLMKHAHAHDMDSAMQPSRQMDIKDSDTQWAHLHHHNHHNQYHHGTSRSSYSPSQPNSDASSGAVGVFSHANTGCAIPLLLSCSPSVVSGSLVKPHPSGISNPAYRTGENLTHYKRDANKMQGKQSVKIQKKPTTLKQ